MANCAYCGKWTRPGKSTRDESCGAQECERYQIDCDEAERQEAHDRVDKDFGVY